MGNVISDTGFWVENEDWEHVFIQELSDKINKYVSLNNIKTVYDFGCGTGEYLNELCKYNPLVEATGVEGHQIDRVFKNIIKLDLAQEQTLNPVDLVISIEVGEHIPEQFESNFIDNIVKHSKKHIILSWAIEGQDGLGHINCKNNDYIIKQMEQRGCVFNKEETSKFREVMPDLWIKNTVMIFSVDKYTGVEV